VVGRRLDPRRNIILGDRFHLSEDLTAYSSGSCLVHPTLGALDRYALTALDVNRLECSVIRSASIKLLHGQQVVRIPANPVTRLALGPRDRVRFVTKLVASSLAIELPGNLDVITIHSAIPGLRFPAQSLEIGDSSLAQTWPREDPDFDLRLIKPTSMGRRVMDGEAAPNFGAISASYTSVSDFQPWMLRSSMTR